MYLLLPRCIVRKDQPGPTMALPAMGNEQPDPVNKQGRCPVHCNAVGGESSSMASLQKAAPCTNNFAMTTKSTKYSAAPN